MLEIYNTGVILIFVILFIMLICDASEEWPGLIEFMWPLGACFAFSLLARC